MITQTYNRLRKYRLPGALVASVFLAFFLTILSASTAQACPRGWTLDTSTEGSGPKTCYNNANPTKKKLQKDFEEKIEDVIYYDQEQNGGNALALFYYSMGLNAEGERIERDTCISCDFITFFTNAIANFSASVFVFFQTFFVALAPLLFAAWIAVRVIRLSVSGGEGGGAFFSDLVKKSALFVIAWGLIFDGTGIMGPVAPGSGSGSTYFAGPMWHIAGPELLAYSFKLNSDVRSQTAQGLMGINAGGIDTGPFECGGLQKRVSTLVNNTALDPAIHAITQTSCVVERMHTLGLSTAVALLVSAWEQSLDSGLAFLSSIFKTIWGLILVIIYGLSAVWLIFLLLDVVTKALIVAAFLPLFGLAALFQPTRSVAQKAILELIGVPVVAFALGLTNLLGFYLIMGTVTIYNDTYQMMGAAYGTALQPIAVSGPVETFAEFLFRIQLPSSEQQQIPADLLSPWLHYMMLVGLGIFTLGKKIVSIIENIMQVQNSSSMADNAKALAIKGGLMAFGGAGLMYKGGKMAAGATGVGLVASAGAASYIGGALTNKLGGKGDAAKSIGASAARWALRRSYNKYTPFGNNKE